MPELLPPSPPDDRLPPDSVNQELAEDTELEAALAYQQGGEEAKPDLLMEAIQEEFGQNLTPTSSSLLTDHFSLDETSEEGEIFRCTNLTKAYGRGVAYNEVIKGISFTVREGEYVVIYGPSGSGKSTLLHMLSGLEPPTRGEIRIRKHSIREFSDDEMALYHREEIGLLFQSFNLLESLRTWENVAFPLMLSGAPYDWRRHEALKILDHFGLADFANYYPQQLSGGQQQRVALARALIHDPALLLVDEPTGNLDTRSAQIVVDELTRLNKQEGRTIILVTHSQEFLPYADRVFYIRDGTLLTSDPTHHDEPIVSTTGGTSA